jgi:cell division protein FtsW (lipid II flippase)
MKIEALKNPAAIGGALILLFIGVMIMTSNQFSVSNKDNSDKKEMARPYRITIGIIVLLMGGIVLFTHLKTHSNEN